MGKPKKGAKTHNEDINDDNEPNEEVTGKKSVEEPGAKTALTAKKEKKKKKGKAKDDDDADECNDDNEPNEEVTGKKSVEEPGAKTAPTAKKEKKKKKGKAKDDDDDDADEWSKDHELKVMSVERNVSVDDDDDDDVPAPTVKSKKGTKKTMGLSAFQLLGELEDDNIMDKSDEDSQVFSHDKSDRGREDEAGENVAVETSKSKKKDKSKKQEKQKKAEDEDIDAIMASLEAADKTAKKKKGKKNKRIEEENSPEEETKEVVEVEKVEPKVVTIDDLDVDDAEYERKKKKKKGKKGAEEVAQSKTVDDKQEHDDGDGEGDEGDEEAGQIKSAAQKRKEKREREKQKKIQEKQKQKKTSKKDEMEEGVKKDESSTQAKKEEIDSVVVKEDEDVGGKEGSPESLAVEGEDKEGGKEDKKKKKKKGVKEKEEKTKSTKQIAAIRERLKKIKEEEEKAREEEEKQRLLEEERIRKYEEQKRLEEERKLKKKMRKKEHIERLKKEGKFLTEKQKQDKKRLEQMLEAMKEAGAELPSKDEVPKKRPVYTKKKKVLAQGATDTQEKSPSPTSLTSPAEPVAHVLETATAISAEKDEEGEDILEADEAQNVEEKDEVKEVWDAESEDEDEEEEDEEEEDSKSRSAVEPVQKIETKEEEELSDEEEDDDDEEDAEEDEEESSEESESEPEDDLTPAERGRDKVTKRAEQANKERSTDNLRAPVVCVLGHVDTGKTKILDKLRRTNVQDGEAGGITQQIGATNVPRDAILDKTKMCKEFTKQELKLPGLLIIDTPGHESFSNLRVRGTSLCDIAILVVDIMHGLEPQTIESINLLKERKTPFVVALNKIDRLYQWKAQPMADVQNTVKKQIPHTKSEFDERAQQVILGLAQEGLNAALFYENKNHKEYISLVPTSAHSGDGMGNLVALICDLCQNLLAKRLMYSANLQAVVMEVKAITGMGTTIDVILINGTLNEGDTIVLAGTEGPIVTQIRGLLMPQPMKELRVKNQYEHHKTVKAAQGVKIIAKDMEKALAGLPLYVAHDADEKEYFKDEVAAVLKDTLESIKVQERGVFVQASTLGSLEALLEFLRTSEIPFAGISIGPVHKKDIMKASVMLEHDSQYAVILAFDVKVERDAQELADNLGVRIFTADIIYHLFDAFTKYREDLKRKRQEEFKHIAVFPCKLRILPQFIFNSRDPIVVGVSVEAGFVKEGTPICVPSKEFVDLGRVASIEMNHKPVEVAKQGQEICIKIMPIPGEAPKMYGRHFDETDMLVSKISRQSIDAVKDHFREEMSKHDWKLMVELKKQFDIL